jgi:hypothetical protein
VSRLLACSCLTPFLLSPASLHAETIIDSKRTTAVATSTIKSGARDDVKIAATGSIELGGGAAVTLDSANSVKNDGTILIRNASNATGILATPSGTGEISNAGKILIDETYAPADADKDGDGDGPFSKQSGNSGIRTGGSFTGTISNSGTISVKGNQGTGIALAGPLTGQLTHSGTIDVLGDGATGIRTAAVSGNVSILGSVAAQGAGAVAVSVEGPVAGQVLIQSSVVSTGYRSTTAPADVSKLDADDLLQGGPAVRIAGSVAGGVLFDIRPKDADPKNADEDKDGVEDAKEGNAAVASYGAAPAVLIGATSGTTAIGALAGSHGGFGLALNGELQGSGVYKGVDGNGLQIGGLGGTVNIAGGIAVNGAVGAKSLDANATGIRIGAGAAVPKLAVAGSVSASSGAGATGQVRAVSIDAGGSLPQLINSGTIAAVATGDATATAIRDGSGTLGLIENTGSITASSKKTAAESAVAIDLQSNGSGATVRQKAVGSGTAAPRISGSVLFGAGNDVFDIADGAVTGTVRFGAGANRLSLSGDAAMMSDVTFGSGADTVALSGTSVLAGTLDLGGGADTLSLGGTGLFVGKLANAAGAAVTVAGGQLDLRSVGAVQLASLNVLGGGTIGVLVDPVTRSATQYQVGTASFAPGTKLAVSIASVGGAEGEYLVVKAGTLTGGANLSATTALLPYMFKGSLTANDSAGQVSLKVQRKSVADLGLTRSQAFAYDAVFAALDKDAKLGGVFLGLRDQDSFQSAVQQLLPDHAGGVFESVTRGSRTLGAYIADPNALVAPLGGGLGFWLQQAVWGTSKTQGQTASYRSSGWGASGGVELETGVGRIGASLAYLNGKANQRRINHGVDSNQYEAALHWRNGWGGLNAYARASAALVDLSGAREFVGALGTETLSRRTSSKWDGTLYTAAGGLSYALQIGRLTIRPAAALDYFRLKEDGHQEKGGGDAFDLLVDARTSDELTASGTVALGYDFSAADAGLFRLEVEGGRRERVAGALGRTTARFKGGQSFSLVADERESGWLGKVRVLAGGEEFRVGGEGTVEEQDGRAALGVRATLSVGF